LNKQDLLALAEEADVEGRTSMSKPDLVRALQREGLRLDAMTKRELLAIGEEQGMDVRASMTKSELISAVTATSSR
jgi:hypothetical protein